MARGWESKAVEAQQDAADNQQPKAPAVTAEEAARRSQRATLSLARTRALSDLQRACAPAHRAMLEQAIADLDQRLAALEAKLTHAADQTPAASPVDPIRGGGQ